MNFQFHSSIKTISAPAWDALWPSDYPFTQHAFLSALEDSNSVDSGTSHKTGWQPYHLTLSQGSRCVAAMPLYIKIHSYGEYVFDWSWADAYARTGLDYYPKIVNAIPFTPASGPRIGFDPELTSEERTSLLNRMLGQVQSFAEENQMSSFHCLFPDASTSALFNKHSGQSENVLARRSGYQFHWFNEGYENFEHFLQSFSSRKRKNIKKERKVAQSHGLEIKMLEASAMQEKDWQDFYLLYQHTYLKRSGHGGYLGLDFFQHVAQALPKQVLLAAVRNEDSLVAGALFFRDQSTLYGRYWGSKLPLDQLHFEACYYQGIDYAIAQKIHRFDPGAQGEHKIQRGFTPISTCSYHQLYLRDFQFAVSEFVEQEARHVDAYIAECRESLPFKEGTKCVHKNILFQQ